MVSPAEGLLMMQGGTDRTGLAGLLDSIGTPGADMMAQRRAEAAEQAAMDEYERRQAEDMAELASLLGGGDEDIIEQPGLIERGQNFLEEQFGDLVPPGISGMSAEEMAKMDELAGIGSELKIDAARGLKNISTPKVPSTGVPKTGGVSLPIGKGPLSVFKRSPVALALSMAPAAAEAMGVDLPETEAVMEQANRPLFSFEGAENPIFDFDPTFGMSDKVKDLFVAVNNNMPLKEQFGMADGGRVGMFLGGSSGTVSPNQGAQSYNQSGFGGGLMHLISQNPLYQTMLQQYRQPTFDFSQVASPSIPQPSVAPATPPQAYTPFVSTMPLYDPSTLGTGLPSTAGMADPFFVYDPYSPVGAFDAPPARTGPTPLTQDKIMETFKNIDKFDVAKQEAKRKAAEAAAKAEAEKKKQRVHPGGGGRNN